MTSIDGCHWWAEEVIWAGLWEQQLYLRVQRTSGSEPGRPGSERGAG